MYERATDLNKFYFDSSAKFALKSQSLQHILKTLNSCIKSDNVIPTKTFLVFKKKGEKDKEKKYNLQHPLTRAIRSKRSKTFSH